VAAQQGYRNGIADGGAISGWLGLTLLQIFVGAQNLAGGPNLPCAVTCSALAIYSVNIAGFVAAVAAAMAAL
jgi:hypothetical protein